MEQILVKVSTYLWQIKPSYEAIEAEDLNVTPGVEIDVGARRVLQYMYPDYETMNEEDFDVDEEE